MAVEVLRRTDLAKWVEEVVEDVDAALSSTQREVEEAEYEAQLRAAAPGAGADLKSLEDAVLANDPGRCGEVLARRRRVIQHNLPDSEPVEPRTLLLRPELALLRKEYNLVTEMNRERCTDRSKWIHIRGPSGCGKSTLLQLFVLQMQRHRPAVYVPLSKSEKPSVDMVQSLVQRALQVSTVNFEPLVVVDDVHIIDYDVLRELMHQALRTPHLTLLTASSSPTAEETLNALPAIKKSFIVFQVPFAPLSSHLVSWVRARYNVDAAKARVVAEVCGGLFAGYRRVLGRPNGTVGAETYGTAYTTYIPGFRKEHLPILEELSSTSYINKYRAPLDTLEEVMKGLRLLYLDEVVTPLPEYAYRLACCIDSRYFPVSPPLYSFMCYKANQIIPFLDQEETAAYIHKKFVVTTERTVPTALEE